MDQKACFLSKTLFLTLIVLSTYGSFSQSPVTFFNDTTLIHITIKGNLKNIIYNLPDSVYSDAELSYNINNSAVSIPVKIRKRGITRQNPEVCSFPPLLVKFGDQAVNSIFTGCDKLKLVTHCQSSQASFEQYLLLEYLAYRFYNLLTEYSFKVRLAKITYIDTNSKRKPLVKYGFFIEELQSMALRVNCSISENEDIPQWKFDQEIAAIMAVFQFMISNTDWSVAKLHNIKLLKYQNREKYIPVAYDFDGSGLVNTPYAKPSEFLGIQSVKERIYRGFYMPDNILDSTFIKFIALRATFYQMIYTQQGLKNQYKQNSIRFLDDFYKIISNQKKKQAYFIAPFK